MAGSRPKDRKGALTMFIEAQTGAKQEYVRSACPCFCRTTRRPSSVPSLVTTHKLFPANQSEVPELEREESGTEFTDPFRIGNPTDKALQEGSRTKLHSCPKFRDPDLP